MESRDDALLSQRLAALPLETPPADAFAAIARRASAPAGWRNRAPMWLSLAAGACALALLPALQRGDRPLIPPTGDVQALMQQSAHLESEIRGLRAGGGEVNDLQYAWESAIQNDLAVVDVGLTVRPASSADLWRERVRLLEELKTASNTDTGTLLLQTRLD